VFSSRLVRIASFQRARPRGRPDAAQTCCESSAEGALDLVEHIGGVHGGRKSRCRRLHERSPPQAGRSSVLIIMELVTAVVSSALILGQVPDLGVCIGGVFILASALLEAMPAKV
jgi:hypothetical protein